MFFRALSLTLYVCLATSSFAADHSTLEENRPTRPVIEETKSTVDEPVEQSSINTKYIALLEKYWLLPKQSIERLNLGQTSPAKVKAEGVAWAMVGMNDLPKFCEEIKALTKENPQDHFYAAFDVGCLVLDRKHGGASLAVIQKLLEKWPEHWGNFATDFANSWDLHITEEIKRSDAIDRAVWVDSRGKMFIKSEEAAHAFEATEDRPKEWSQIRADHGNQTEAKALFLEANRSTPMPKIDFGKVETQASRSGASGNFKNPYEGIDLALIGAKNAQGDGYLLNAVRSAKQNNIPYVFVTDAKDAIKKINEFLESHPEKKAKGIGIAINDHGHSNAISVGGGQNPSPHNELSIYFNGKPSSGFLDFVQGLKTVPTTINRMTLFGCHTGQGTSTQNSTGLLHALANWISSSNYYVQGKQVNPVITAWDTLVYAGFNGNKYIFFGESGVNRWDVTGAPQLNIREKTE